MSIAIMQPYFFPYVGYFQLLKAVDVFVFYDDVNYINRGWINRNKILVNSRENLISIPLKNASQNRLINEVELSLDDKSKSKILKTIEFSYKKSPCFSAVFPIIEDTLNSRSITIADLAERSIKNVASYLDLTIKFKRSSESYKNMELKKADRLIDICLKEDITDYINPIGGKEIYSKDYFKQKGINLYFLKTELQPYPQDCKEFIPGLSIIDVLMNNSKEEIMDKQITKFELI